MEQQKVIPWYWQPAERRTKAIRARIYRDQAEYLEQEFGSESSRLIRFLLDQYIAGKVEDKFTP